MEYKIQILFSKFSNHLMITTMDYSTNRRRSFSQSSIQDIFSIVPRFSRYCSLATQKKYRSNRPGSNQRSSSYLSTYLSTYRYIVTVKVTTEVKAVMKFCVLRSPSTCSLHSLYGHMTTNLITEKTGVLVKSATGKQLPRTTKTAHDPSMTSRPI